MKRSILILTAALLAASSVQATTWFRTYGGSGYDEGRCVQEVEDGYIVTGFSKSYDSGKAALWLLKTDTLGNEIWSKTYGATDTTEAVGNFVRQTQDGGYIATGKLRKDYSKIWVLKLDENGDTVWTQIFGSEFGIGNCVQNTFDNGFILTGQKGAFPYSLFLLKIDSLGDSTWMKTYELGNWVSSLGYHIQQAADVGYVTVGFIGDTLYGQERYAFWLVKTDSLGDTIWTYTQGGDEWGEYDIGLCVLENRNLEYVSLANFGLFNFDTLGDTLWMRNYAGGSSLDITIDREYILTGNAGTVNLFAPAPANAGNIWLFKTDGQGDSLWKRSYFEGVSYYVQQTQDKGFVATGYRAGDLFLLKTDSLGLLEITEDPIVETDRGWNVSHSIGSYIVLHYQGLSQGFKANVFDVSGRKVDQIKGDGNEGAMTWGINHPPGVYFIQALDNQNQLKTAKVVLVR